MGKKKAIITDIGNVIYPERWDLVIEKVHEINPGTKIEDFRKAFEINWNAYKISAIRRVRFWTGVAREIGLSEQHNRILSRAFKMIWHGPYPEMVDFFRGLKERVNIYALSNSCHENGERLEEDIKSGKIDFFKKLYLSHQKRKSKPDAESYLQVLQDNNIEADKCVFIDDKTRNTAVAEKLGIYTVLHESFEKTKGKLEKII